MDARPKTRRINRQRIDPATQPPRGAKQIVIPMTQEQYDEPWHQPDRLRAFLDEWGQSAPELFPIGFEQGFRFQGFGRTSRKLPGIKLRKLVLADGSFYWLRPSFVTSYMTSNSRPLERGSSLLAHFDTDWLMDHHRDVEKGLKYGWLKPKPPDFGGRQPDSSVDCAPRT